MRFCTNCGEPIDDNAKYCKTCGHKHQKEGNLIVFYIIMILAVIIFDVVSNKILAFSNTLINNSSYGLDFILEGIWALIVFFILILAGNTYIFRRKKMSLLKSLCLPVPILFTIVMYIIMYFGDAVAYSPIDVACVFFLCICIGLMEEFLIRGWVLTEFLERYGYDRKHIHIAILLSASIFAGMHITNAFNGQDAFNTALQIIQTFGSGYLFGCLFFRTRNIWSCVITHGLYDFSIYLSEIAAFQACTSAAETPTTMAIEIGISILYAVIDIAFGEIIIRKSKTNDLVPEPEELKESDIIKSEQLQKKLIGFVVGCYILLEVLAQFLPMETTCTSYNKKDLPENYYVTKQHVNTYSINYLDYSFDILNVDDTYKIVNKNTSYSIDLDEDVVAIVEMNNSSYFALCEVLLDSTTYDYTLRYIQIDYTEINNDNSFLDELFDKAEEYEVPTISSIGTISYDEGGEEYLYFESDQIKYGMIDSDKNLYELEESNE